VSGWEHLAAVQRLREQGRMQDAAAGSAVFEQPAGLPPCLRWTIFRPTTSAMAALRMDGLRCGSR